MGLSATVGMPLLAVTRVAAALCVLRVSCVLIRVVVVIVPVASLSHLRPFHVGP